MIIGLPDQVKTLFDSMRISYAQDSDGTYYAWYPCATPPKITFKFGTKSIALGSAASYGSAGGNLCYLSIIGSDIGINSWIFGDPLFQRATITFDVANKSVGFN